MRRNLVATTALGLSVVALLVSDPAAAQDLPDFSGHWVLDSVAPPAEEISTTLVIRQSLARTNVRGEPMKPFFKDVTVTRELASGTRSETYLIGTIGGTVPGRAGLPHSHQRVGWQDSALVIETGTYTGSAPQSGEWTELREVWTVDPNGRLQLVIISSNSRGGSNTVTLFYRRQ